MYISQNADRRDKEKLWEKFEKISYYIQGKNVFNNGCSSIIKYGDEKTVELQLLNVERKKSQLRIISPVKTFFRNEGEIKHFHLKEN